METHTLHWRQVFIIDDLILVLVSNGFLWLFDPYHIYIQINNIGTLNHVPFVQAHYTIFLAGSEMFSFWRGLIAPLPLRSQKLSNVVTSDKRC